MAIIDVIEKRNQYFNLLDNLEIIKKKIDNSIEHINKSMEWYQKSYTIDEKMVDNNNLSEIRKNLIDISDRLSVNINEVNNTISTLSNFINGNR